MLDSHVSSDKNHGIITDLVLFNGQRADIQTQGYYLGTLQLQQGKDEGDYSKIKDDQRIELQSVRLEVEQKVIANVNIFVDFELDESNTGQIRLASFGSEFKPGSFLISLVDNEEVVDQVSFTDNINMSSYNPDGQNTFLSFKDAPSTGFHKKVMLQL